MVLRHLPPSLGQSDLFAQIDDRFGNRYNWVSFRSGKSSHKHQRYSRAYIDFKNPEDVLEFADFFDGHVFVNEKGVQLKAIAEYAPSQRVPKPSGKKDGREGTIFKDPDYLEFLKLIAKPVENLPSAEIQLERKEAELSGAPKETLVITPLMEYVRQKRAAENGAQGSATIGKVRRAGTTTKGKPRGSAAKRSSEKKKYVLKESTKATSRKDKFASASAIVSRREDKSATSSVSGMDTPVTGVTLTSESGKKKILLLKSKDREAPHMHEGVSQLQGAVSHVTSLSSSSASRPVQRREAGGGRLIRSILLNNEASQSSAAVQPQQKSRHNEPLPFSSDVDAKKESDDKFVKKDRHVLGSTSEKNEKRTRNKDRADRGVWAPLRRGDFEQANEGHSTPDSTEGSHRHFGRRSRVHSLKDDGSMALSEVKSSKKGGAAGGAQEKQVWVQKPSTGS